MNPDEPANPQGEQPLDEMALITRAVNSTKIPDPIKALQEYWGDKTSLFQWINSVENILLAYQNIAHLPSFQIWLMAIRNKIKGDAEKAIENRQAREWNDVKEVLIEYFGDRRDLSTITQKIPYLNQGSRPLDEYYHETIQLMADVHQKVSLDPENIGHVHAIMRVLEPIITTGFVDGLNGQMANYVRSHDVLTMIDAYKAALKHEQAECRAREKAVRLNAEKFQQKGRGGIQRNFSAPRFQGQNNQPRNAQISYNPTFPNKGGNQNYGPPQPQPQPQPQYFQNRGGNPNVAPPGPSRNNYQDNDVSMRTRRSNAQMSGISYRTNPMHNIEGEEASDIDNVEEENIEEDEVVDQLNFQLSLEQGQGT